MKEKSRPRIFTDCSPQGHEKAFPSKCGKFGEGLTGKPEREKRREETVPRWNETGNGHRWTSFSRRYVHGLWIFRKIPRSTMELHSIFQRMPVRGGIPAGNGRWDDEFMGKRNFLHGSFRFSHGNKPGDSFLLAFGEPALHISSISIFTYEF
ncbi:MAG: hypothetical protein LUE13_04915 [Akkermansiaceae bacterium]|nr:hypothetical protein [Akkermansiaceae bacterium]